MSRFSLKENLEVLIHLKNVILLLLILIDLSFIIAITFFNIEGSDLFFMAVFDLIVCFILFLNLIGIYIYSDDNLTTFIKKHIIDIISMIPFNFIFLRYLAVFRIFRILQVLSVVRIFNLKSINDESFRYFVHNRLLKVLTVILIAYMILSSVILFAIDDSFKSIFDALWYNIVTVAAVGYGDITPLSFTGRIIGVLTIIVGVLFISVFTAAMSGIYMEGPERKTRNKLRNEIRDLKEENTKLNTEVKEIHEKLDEINRKLDNLNNE